MPAGGGDLAVHICGGNVGESIVLELPGGRWGLVDNYTPNLADPFSSSSFRLLKAHGVSKLDFVCLTHPDSDHFRGMGDFLKNFDVQQFWVFGGMSTPELYGRIATFLQAKAETLNRPRTEIADASDLHSTLKIVTAKRKEGTLKVIRMQLGLPLYTIPESSGQPRLEITALGPSGNSVARYEENLEKCFDGKTPERFLASKAPKVRNNLLSGALLLKFGDVSVVLGGDMETEGWRDVLNYQVSPLPLRSVLVKASHHGSATGYCEKLWEEHLSPGRCAAGVVTAFAPKRLPRQEGLEYLQGNTSALFTTSADAILSQLSTLHKQAAVFTGLSAQAALVLHSLFRSARPKRINNRGICSFFIDSDHRVSCHTSGDAVQISG